VPEPQAGEGGRQRFVGAVGDPPGKGSGGAFGEQSAEPGVAFPGRNVGAAQDRDLAAVALVEAVHDPQYDAGPLLGGGLKDLFLGIVVDLGCLWRVPQQHPRHSITMVEGAAWLRAAAARLMRGPARR